MANHTYGVHPHQVAELTLPEGEPPAAGWPVAVVVHGGFWTTANGGADRMVGLCADLVSRGWASWNVEYRRLGGGGDGGWPQTFGDVAAATDHLATLTGEPLDLTRVASIGHSAGGHLTLLDAARSGATVRVRATIAQAPVTDVLHAHALGGPGVEIIETFMGGSPETRADAYAAASPVQQLPLGVPTLVVQGELDDLVPTPMVTAFAEAAGEECELALLPGVGHFDHLEPDSPAWATVVDWIRRFG
ncbi:MAG: prolyl oligopeptidase family serine peptidase [Solirubrobacterales bacterium]|nr:prolyl oligopeptidase family serine peptidase [Solirubrobacterales bacterium]